MAALQLRQRYCLKPLLKPINNRQVMLVAARVWQRGYNEVYDAEVLCRLREYSHFLPSMPNDLTFLACDTLSGQRIRIFFHGWL